MTLNYAIRFHLTSKEKRLTLDFLVYSIGKTLPLSFHLFQVQPWFLRPWSMGGVSLAIAAKQC